MNERQTNQYCFVHNHGQENLAARAIIGFDFGMLRCYSRVCIQLEYTHLVHEYCNMLLGCRVADQQSPPIHGHPPIMQPNASIPVFHNHKLIYLYIWPYIYDVLQYGHVV